MNVYIVDVNGDESTTNTYINVQELIQVYNGAYILKFYDEDNDVTYCKTVEGKLYRVIPDEKLPF